MPLFFAYLLLVQPITSATKSETLVEKGLVFDCKLAKLCFASLFQIAAATGNTGASKFDTPAFRQMLWESQFVSYVCKTLSLERNSFSYQMRADIDAIIALRESVNDVSLDVAAELMFGLLVGRQDTHSWAAIMPLFGCACLYRWGSTNHASTKKKLLLGANKSPKLATCIDQHSKDLVLRFFDGAAIEVLHNQTVSELLPTSQEALLIMIAIKHLLEAYFACDLDRLQQHLLKECKRYDRSTKFPDIDALPLFQSHIIPMCEVGAARLAKNQAKGTTKKPSVPYSKIEISLFMEARNEVKENGKLQDKHFRAAMLTASTSNIPDGIGGESVPNLFYKSRMIADADTNAIGGGSEKKKRRKNTTACLVMDLDSSSDDEDDDDDSQELQDETIEAAETAGSAAGGVPI